MEDYFVEYAICRIVGGGSPYIVNHYRSLTEAIYILRNNFIRDDEKKHRLYYVDNDFFPNKYNNLMGLSNFNYYKIVQRKITDWLDLREETEEEDKSNIIFFENYIDK